MYCFYNRNNFYYYLIVSFAAINQCLAQMFWGGRSSPFLSNIGEQFFPPDAFQSPTFFYQTSDSRYQRFPNDISADSTTTTKQPVIIDLKQAEPKPFGAVRNARPVGTNIIINSPETGQIISSNGQAKIIPKLSPGSSAIEIALPIPDGAPTVYGPLPSSSTLCPTGFLCCDGGSVYRNTFRLLGCCSEHSYDMRFERCSEGVVSPYRLGTVTLTPAERLAHISCGGQLYFGPSILRCCNGTFYDSTKYKCTTGQPQQQTPAPESWSADSPTAATLLEDDFDLPDMGPGPLGPQYVVCEIYRYKLSPRDLQTWGCCGSQIYNFRRENCTTGEILPQRTMMRQKAMPIGELLIYCNGGVQHWVKPAVLAHVRCCGSELCPIFPPTK